MNIKDFIQSSKREDAFGASLGQVSIVLPVALYEGTMQMCTSTEKETRGILVCTKSTVNSNLLIVAAMIPLGIGTSTVVFPDEEKYNRAISWFQRNPEFVPIDFHSHTTATGQAYYDSFSQGDVNAFISMVNKNNDYKHVLFTPTHICTFGIKKPVFIVAAVHGKSDDQVIEEHVRILEEFKS